MTGGDEVGLYHPGKQRAIKSLGYIHVLAVAGVKDQQIQPGQAGGNLCHGGAVPCIELQGGDPLMSQCLQPLAVAATAPHLPASASIIERQLATYAGGGPGDQHTSAHVPSLPLMARTTGPSSGNCS
ncbi:hypothetical protein D3C80_1411460 [compost metagenome]